MLQEGFEEWQPIIQQPRVYFMVKNLLPNTSYHFRVTAINDYGASPPSEGTKVVMGVKGRWQSFRRGHVPAITINTSIGENYHCVIIIIYLTAHNYSSWDRPISELKCAFSSSLIELQDDVVICFGPNLFILEDKAQPLCFHRN